MSQLSYTVDMEKGFEGMIQDGHHVDGRSVIVEDATDLRCGLAVKRGTADDCIVKMAAATDVIQGVLAFFHKQRQGSSAINDKESAMVVRKGRVYVKVTADVTPDDSVSVNAAGEFGTGGTALTGFSYQSSALSGELAILDINLPA